MSEPYTDDESNDELDDKYIYCPQYDLYLLNIKPKLVKRLTKHFKNKQEQITICANKILPHVETLCKKFDNILFNGTTNYDVNKINNIIPYIKKFICNWKGPIISKDYKKKFNDPEQRKKIKCDNLFSNAKKFNHNSRNWCDQSSGNVEAEFIVMHVEEIKLYIRRWCAGIHVSYEQRECIANYMWCYFVYELLIATIIFTRTQGKPLIRNKTLKRCGKLQKCLGINKFVEKFKLIEKQLKKNKKENERIKISEIFVKRLVEERKEILNEAKAKLCATFTINKSQDGYNNNIECNTYYSSNDNVSMTSNESALHTPIISSHSYNNIEYNEVKYDYNSLPPPIQQNQVYNNSNNVSTRYEYEYNPFQYNYDNNRMNGYQNNLHQNYGYNHMIYNNNNRINYEPMYYGNKHSGYNSSEYRWTPYHMHYNQVRRIPPNSNIPITNTYYNQPNGRNYDENTERNNSNEFINNTFNDGNTNHYYDNYNDSVIGDGITEVNLYGAMELSEQINREMPVDVVNNIRWRPSNAIITNGRNYDNNSNGYNENIIGDYIQEVHLHDAPQLSELINGDVAVNAVNNEQ